MSLKIGDMVTKRMVFNEDTNTLIVLGRKSLHFIDLDKFDTYSISTLGEDGAENSATKFSELCKNIED